jgi:short-subunit dehydrogenase
MEAYYMKTVVITGAGRGLGYELLRQFYEKGYTVFPIIRKPSLIQMIKKQFPDNCFPILADIGEDSSIETIRKQLDKSTVSIDILINNAGIRGKEKSIFNIKSEEMHELFNVHCIGAIRTIQSVMPFLKNSDNPRIINISSRLGSLSKMASDEFKDGMFSYSYRIAKASQNMLTLCLHNELNPLGIHVSAVHPGKLKTSSGPVDADKEPSESARHMFEWIETLNKENSKQYVEPGINQLGW